LWQVSVGVHSEPETHAPHEPLSQTSFVPHVVPLLTFLFASTHTGVPVVQDVVPE
jgi:hypothetical protein